MKQVTDEMLSALQKAVVDIVNCYPNTHIQSVVIEDNGQVSLNDGIGVYTQFQLDKSKGEQR